MRLSVLAVPTLVACAPVLPAPAPRAVEPAWGWNGETTDVEIRGSDFFPRMQAAGSEQVSVDRQFRVWLEDERPVELEGVSFVGETLLRARVPSGLDEGRYDIRVEGPSGEQGTLQDAFVVTDSRADRIDVSATDVSWPVNSLARVDLQLADPDGAAVPEIAAVEVMLRGIGDPATLHFEDTLDDQSLFFDTSLNQVGVRGRLGPDGSGHLVFTSTTPAELWLDVAPTETDSILRGASQFLSFTPAAATQVVVEPVDPEALLVAGEPADFRVSLVDAFGNVATDAAGAVTFFESCGSPTGRWTDAVTFVGTTVLRDVELHGATLAGGGMTCERSVIEAVGNVLGTTVTGRSVDLAIAPGSATAYGLDAWPQVVVAGADEVSVWAEAMDKHRNRVPAHTAAVSLADDRGGLSSETASCTGFSDGMARCTGTPVVAGTDVTLEVRDAEGRVGRLSGLTVEPAPPTQLEVGVPSTSVTAGLPFPLTLRAEDRFGNGVTLDIEGVDTASFTGPDGGVDCTWQSTDPGTATESFSCVLTRARANMAVTAAVPFRGLVSESGAFTVVNGGLAGARLTVTGLPAVAGESLGVSIQAEDAYGNPYRVQTVNNLTLWDTAGDLGGTPVTLSAAGVATTTATLTTAFEGTTLSVRSGSTALGSSTPFDVTAATPVDLIVRPARSWSWLEEPLSVTVTAVDTYGNPVRAYSQPVTLSSGASAGEALVLSTFGSGTAEAEFVWDTAVLQDTLLASDGNLSGQSDTVDAVENCADGPEGALTVGGDTSLVICRSAGSTPSTTLSSASSSAGSGSLVATHFAAEPGEWVRVAGTSTTHSWTDTGTWLIEALVVDDNACADRVSARVWSADNDGEAAGPISLVPDETSLTSGSTTEGASSVFLEATDCAGDPAAGATVLVRTDLGTLASGSSTVTSTGDGLAVLLDSSGAADFQWSVTGERHAGDARLFAGRAGGEALGTAVLPVSGDAARPTVLEVYPLGSTSAAFSEVEVVFSEPLLPESISASSVALTAPDGIAVAGTRTLGADDTTLTLSLPSSQDAGSGVWTLDLSDALRDAAGNRLAGQFTSGSAPLSLDFGAVPDTAPAVVSCPVSTSTFRPDGDPGPGSAADSVLVTTTANAQPGWWELEVTNSDGDLVLLTRTLATSPSASLAWNGRGQDGFISDNGDHFLTVTALDGHWNAGASCTQTVRVANHVSALD